MTTVTAKNTIIPNTSRLTQVNKKLTVHLELPQTMAPLKTPKTKPLDGKKKINGAVPVSVKGEVREQRPKNKFRKSRNGTRS